jgi:hypothetical protein
LKLGLKEKAEIRGISFPCLALKRYEINGNLKANYP